ncbi:hypothetical protein LIT25_27400 (plasmid) [Bacillus sp. F19]|nr:hypothetical protein LIT25_27400 [Bacillus sp. F19]
MFTNAEIINSESVNGRMQLTIQGIFHAIENIECYESKLYIHFDRINKTRRMTEMVLLNKASGSYESVKGMYDEEFEEKIVEAAINKIHFKQSA